MQVGLQVKFKITQILIKNLQLLCAVSKIAEKHFKVHKHA